MTIESLTTWLTHYNPQTLQNEDDVETKFVLPLFRHLGYPEEARRGKYPIKIYRPGNRGRKPEIDQVYFSETDPNQQSPRSSLVIVEAKEPDKTNLDEDVAQAKFYGYFLSSPFLVVTNGNSIKIIRRHFYQEEMLFDITADNLKEDQTIVAFFEELNFETVKRINDYVVENPKQLDFDNYSPVVPNFFFGREAELESLSEAIQQNHVVIIGGIAGIGKTHLAAEFVRQVNQKYSIIWLECKPSLQLEQFLAGLARHFESHFNDPSLHSVLRSPNTDESQRFVSSVELIDTYSCMLVWDGFDQNANQSFLPLLEACSNRLQSGKLIVTTREWIDPIEYDLLNPPYCIPTISRLEEEASIDLLKRLGVEDYPDERLIQAYHRVDGHPKFLTILAGLSKKHPLPSLLEELPYVPNQVHRYLKKRVFDDLEATPKRLLEELAILRIPFHISVIKCLISEPDCYDAFDVLCSRFLVTIQNQDNKQTYQIHDLLREFAISKISASDLATIHANLHSYYERLPEKRYLDLYESIYHALNANLLDEADKTINELIGSANYFGAYDLTLEYSNELLKDERIQNQGLIYHARGRALRFKGQYSEALDAYQSAVDFALTEEHKEKAKMEIASVLVKRFEQQEETALDDLQLAKDYYTEMTHSSDPEIRIQAMGVLGSLNAKEDAEEGIAQMREALSLAESSNMLRNVAFLYHSLGLAYEALKDDSSQAIHSYEKSLSIQDNEDKFGPVNPEAWTATHLRLGQLYSEEGRLIDALKSYKACVKVERALGLQQSLARSLYYLGREECRAEEYIDAKNSLLESLSLVQTHDFDIEFGAERAIYEWLSVVLWNLGEYEKAMEYSMDYIKMCHEEGRTPNPHPVILESNLTPDADFTEINKMGGHILILPSQYSLGDLGEWQRNLIMRRPDLAEFSLNLFHKTEYQPRIGRNNPCPCGSGKKYKHCHGRKNRN